MNNLDLEIKYFNKKWDRQLSRLRSKYLCDEPIKIGKTLQDVIGSNTFVMDYTIDPLSVKNELNIYISISEYHYNNLVLRKTAQSDIYKAVDEFLHTNTEAHKLYRNTLEIERINVMCSPMSPSVKRILMIQKAFAKMQITVGDFANGLGKFKLK